MELSPATEPAPVASFKKTKRPVYTSLTLEEEEEEENKVVSPSALSVKHWLLHFRYPATADTSRHQGFLRTATPHLTLTVLTYNMWKGTISVAALQFKTTGTSRLSDTYESAVIQPGAGILQMKAHPRPEWHNTLHHAT